MTYNLDENLEEHFEFVLKGNTYRMRYPTTDEMDEVAKLKSDEEIVKRMYKFISPIEKDAMPIAEALGKTNIKAAQRFINMVKKEFMGGE